MTVIVNYDVPARWKPYPLWKDGDKVTVNYLEFEGTYYLVNGCLITEAEYLKYKVEHADN